jgi:hypothetical protein
MREPTSYHRLPGPPISKDTALVVLLEHRVKVGLGVRLANAARNARFDVAWVSASVTLPHGTSL